MHRFFIKENVINGKVVKIMGSDFNHISHSLRMQSGDKFIVNSGDGLDHLVEIQEISNDVVIAEIIKSQKNSNEPDISITLAQAIPKKSNMDLIVQKCTEIGINSIIPIETSRTIVKLNGKKLERRIYRWQKIAEEAAKQSRRGKIPLIDDLYDLRKLHTRFEEYNLVLVLWEDEESIGIRERLQQNNDLEKMKILIIIGPEGGFSVDEIDYIKDKGGFSVTLGPRILRTETAGFVALTSILYQAGELGG
ncbi:MAG: 16S rRNA (uracil(1498)-N(3))-methyltransferase [Bacillota bacterium]